MAVKWAKAHFTNGQTPIIMRAMLDDLLREIDAHLAWRASRGKAMAESTFGRLAVDDGKLVARLRGGGDITVSKLTKILEFIADDRKAVAREMTSHHGAVA